MTQHKKFNIIILLWGATLMFAPQINFYLYHKDWTITLLNGEQESVYYISWLITYRFLYPIVFSITWLILVQNHEFRKWIYPVLVSSCIGILTVFISAIKGLSWLIHLSFFLTTLTLFFENKKLIIILTILTIVSMIFTFAWYFDYIKNLLYLPKKDITNNINNCEIAIYQI